MANYTEECELEYSDIDEDLPSIEKLRIKYNRYLKEGQKHSNYTKLKSKNEENSL